MTHIMEYMENTPIAHMHTPQNYTPLRSQISQFHHFVSVISGSIFNSHYKMQVQLFARNEFKSRSLLFQ